MTERNGWRMLVIPAIATSDEDYRTGPGPQDVHRRRRGDVLLPDREPQAVLDKMRFAMGSMNFAAQYQQDPVPAGGNVIKSEWIRYFDEQPNIFELLVSTWDLASTVGTRSSYSVGQLWGVVGTKYFLLEVRRERLEPPDLRRLMISSLEEWQPNATVIEDTELGRTMQKDLIRSADRIGLQHPILRASKVSKLARLEAQAPRFEAAQVFLPREAPWLGTYLQELLAFPYGRSDDQVDATSLALDYIMGVIARRAPLVRRNPVRRNIVRR